MRSLLQNSRALGEGKPCRYLVGEGHGDYECGLYDFIVEQPDAEVAPAFGIGCCYDLNPGRQALGHTGRFDGTAGSTIDNGLTVE